MREHLQEKKNMDRLNFVLLLLFSCLVKVHGEDPYLFFDWNVTYGTISPLACLSKSF